MQIGFFYEYKGYTGTINYEINGNFYYGRIADISDLVTYRADTCHKLYEEFIKAVDDYLSFKGNIETAKKLLESNNYIVTRKEIK